MKFLRNKEGFTKLEGSIIIGVLSLLILGITFYLRQSSQVLGHQYFRNEANKVHSKIRRTLYGHPYGCSAFLSGQRIVRSKTPLDTNIGQTKGGVFFEY